MTTLPTFGRQRPAQKEMEDLRKEIRELEEDFIPSTDRERQFLEDGFLENCIPVVGGVDSSVKSLETKIDFSKLPSIFKKAGVTFQEGDQERILETVASDGSLDAMKDILNPAGWDLKSFKKNPVLLFNHSMREPIGAVVRVRSEDNPDFKPDMEDHEKTRLMAIPYFARTEEGDRILTLFKTGILRTFSVRFRSFKLRQLSDQEREDLGLTSYFSIFSEKQRLVELSAVTIPANDNARVTAKSLDEDVLHNFAERMDGVFEKMEQAIEKLTTVGDPLKFLDSIREDLRGLGTGQKTRADELYGSGLDYEQLTNYIENFHLEL